MKLFPFSFAQVTRLQRSIQVMLVVTLLTALLLPAQLFAQNQTGTVAAGVVLNVRSGPGTSNSVIGRLNGGTSVTILGSDDSGAWYRITSSAFSGEGWVSASFVSSGGAPAAAPAAAPAQAGDGGTVTVRSGRINVRSGPGQPMALSVQLRQEPHYSKARIRRVTGCRLRKWHQRWLSLCQPDQCWR